MWQLTAEQTTSGEYYGFTWIGLSSSLTDGGGGFGLQFGNDGIVNDAKPTPCSAADSRDIIYLQKIFAFIEAQSTVLDASKVFT